jgi:ribosomal protein S18 acetylase RimI-like enzyme
VIVRAATAADLDFLRTMLYEAATWRPGPRPPAETVLAEPAVARYLRGWGRHGDSALIACEDDRPVGAAWYRLFPEDDAGYGFVATEVPELSIGVAADARGRGVGTLLLDALVAEARDGGFPALTLSVEPDNPAVRLYERAGFSRVPSTGGSWTMVLALRPA